MPADAQASGNTETRGIAECYTDLPKPETVLHAASIGVPVSLKLTDSTINAQALQGLDDKALEEEDEMLDTFVKQVRAEMSNDAFITKIVSELKSVVCLDKNEFHQKDSLLYHRFLPKRFAFSYCKVWSYISAKAGSFAVSQGFLVIKVLRKL